MALWCRHLPTVTVDRSTVPKAVTLVYPFYENTDFFATQVSGWRTYPVDLLPYVSAIVVDDGSPVPAILPRNPPFPIRLFRIEVDVRWNWLAARNIGAHHAPDGWMLLTDMDHVVPTETLDALIYGVHRPDTVYAFSRKEYTDEPIQPHSASFFMTRKLFWKIGGYEEELSGKYGTDGDFRRRASKVAPFALLPVPLVRHEYQGDSSTTRYKRKQPEDAEVSRIVAARLRGWTPKVLSFPYHEVTC